MEHELCRGQFSRKQLDVIANADAGLNILDGSVRSGKTISSLVAWIYFVNKHHQGELLMVEKQSGPKAKHLRSTGADCGH